MTLDQGSIWPRKRSARAPAAPAELAPDHRTDLRSGERRFFLFLCFFYSDLIGSVKNTYTQPAVYGRRRRSKLDQTTTKFETKMQKRTGILDSYRFDEKIREKRRSATKTSTSMQSRLWRKLRTLNFCGFFCIGQKQKRIYGDEFVDAHRVNARI
jgi:hypothetical protein